MPAGLASRAILLSAVGLLVAGCEGPLGGYDAARLQRLVIADAQRQLPEEAGPPVAEDVAGDELTDAQRQELDKISGPGRYDMGRLDAGTDLLGRQSAGASLSLDRAVTLAVGNNLRVHIARLIPAISGQQVTEAQAAFDFDLFGHLSYANVDRARQGANVGLLTLLPPQDTQKMTDADIGLRKRLQTGGAVSLSTGFTHQNQQTPTVTGVPDPAAVTDVTLGVTQPLLRNAGSTVNRAQIVLAANRSARDQQSLREQVMAVIAEVSQAYWQVVHARHALAVRQRLLDDTVAIHQDLKARRELDASPLEIAQAASAVAVRRGELIVARRALRDASDALKQLLHAPDLPLVGEAVIEPTDRPIEQAEPTTLGQAIVTALRQRPEMARARLDMEDAWTRLQVADNQRLPKLDLTGQLSYQGLDDDIGTSYDRLTDSHFIDWLIGLEFEQPIGNRAAKAAYERQRLARQAQALQYRHTAEQVILSVKQAMRALTSARQLIEINREARRAAADHLRAIEEREKSSSRLTPEFLLDLKLSAQHRLGEAELIESRVIVDYNIARARFLQATGALLDHHQIDLAAPPARASVEK